MNENIDQIEIVKRITQIDEQIRQLQDERNATLRQDEEYAEYLDAWEERGAGTEPLPYDVFDMFSDQLGGLRAGLVALDGGDFDQAWPQVKHRIKWLEKRLLA